MTNLIMDHEGDPKQKLIDALGDLSEIELFNNKILVAVYIRPEKTKSGLYLSDKYRDEDRFQGKVGLLVGAGPDAFADENGAWFHILHRDNRKSTREKSNAGKVDYHNIGACYDVLGVVAAGT